MRLTVGSTFSGIGGLELAAERHGIDVQWQSEINPDANAVLDTRFPGVPNHGDISKMKAEDIAAVDIMCGGFPCQDLSVSGKRAGLAGERSGLFYEFVRIAYENRPTWIILENVPGLLSSQRGRDMGAVIGALVDLGYGVAWRVLDAQNFGVPQRRRRVVIVGHLGDPTVAGQVLFESEGSGGNSTPSRRSGTVVAALTASGVGTCGADDNQGQGGHLIPSVARSQSTSNGRMDGDTETFIPYHIGSGSRPTFTENQSTTLTTRRGGTVTFAENIRGEVRAVARIPQALVGAQQNPHGSPDSLVRACHLGRLAFRTCPTQGFPDGWTDVPNAKGKQMSDSARYRMLGNAVAVPVFEWVFGRLVAM